MDLGELERALAVFAGLGPTQWPLHHAQVFVLIARRGEVSYPEIGEELSLAPSSVSRTVAALGEVNRHGDDGFGLVASERDPTYGRRFVARLTTKGRAIARQIELI